jgi:hypothetical protein
MPETCNQARYCRTGQVSGCTNGSTSTFLVGLTVTQQHLQAITCILNVFDGQGGQFAAPEAVASTNRQRVKFLERTVPIILFGRRTVDPLRFLRQHIAAS